MRVCFLGSNVCALGYGVAMIQTLPLSEDPVPREGDAAKALDVDARPKPQGPYIHRNFRTVSGERP